jgi:hypothetical protein
MIDGKPRSHRDRIEVVIEAAEFLKRKSPNLRCRREGPAKRRGNHGGAQGRHWTALMTLTLRPTGLASGAYQDRQNWTVFEDGKEVGRMRMG